MLYSEIREKIRYRHSTLVGENDKLKVSTAQLGDSTLRDGVGGAHYLWLSSKK
jgi:hypothetical protein